MGKRIRIGTRDSQLAIWQARQVQDKLFEQGWQADLVPIKSEGDLDLITPLYEMGVQGIFTKTLDAALLTDRIDLAVHSLKDVPTLPASGIIQAAVLKRGSWTDILVPKPSADTTGPEWKSMERGDMLPDGCAPRVIATSSIRRKSQWLHRYPQHRIESLRGNVNTRLRKLSENDWDGAIFAAAGLERIGLRPTHAINLDWMLPAPAQGAIAVMARASDTDSVDACLPLNDKDTERCTTMERTFLRALLGGCTTPISALATIEGDTVVFRGNILTPDGKSRIDVEKRQPASATGNLGNEAAEELLDRGGRAIIETLANAGR